MSAAVRLSAICLIVGTLAIAADRDWLKYPAVVQLDTAEDIFAIGDVHSDYERFTLVLSAAGLIDRAPDVQTRWRGGRSILVVTGDMIDKGPRAVDVLRLLIGLQSAAARAGGRVIVLAGNHEAEFLANPNAVKGKEFASQLIADGLRTADMGACKGEIGEFLCSLPFAARVNDWFFSHAGSTAGRSIDQIAGDVQKGFAQDGFGAKQLIGNYSILEARLNGEGPGREPWIDAGMPGRGEKQLLTDYAAALGVKHIVQGHVPSQVRFADGKIRQPGEMYQRFGLLFLIDTGMSQDVNDSRGAVLHITSKNATAICPDGKKIILWDAASNPDVGRAAPCGK
jgi:hypothetical protein